MGLGQRRPLSGGQDGRHIDTKITKLGGYWHHVLGHLIGFVVLVGLVAFGALMIGFEPSLEKVYHWIISHIS